MSIQLNMTTMGKEASLEGLEFDGDTVLCRVCGDKASGFHYGVHACEGCKGFFRRSIQQKIQYRPCLKNQQCNIMRVNRNRCQYCRLKKCVAVGMSKDAVRFGRVPKKEKARIIEQMHKSSLHSQASQMVNMIQNPQELIQIIVAAHQQTTMLSLDQVHCIRKEGLRNQDFVECPAHMACPLNSHLSDNDEDGQGWMDMSEFFTPAIKSVVNFARLIPGFSHLSQDDQVTLLKAATFEVLLVRFACLFDPDTNTMMFTNGKIFKRGPAQISTNAGFLLDSMFDFADRFNSLNLSEEEIALFSAVVLLSPDRPGLRNTENLENFQMKLTECLQTVISANHKDNTLFAKLLMKTTDLRTLSTLHSEKSIGTTDRARSQATESTDHHEAQFDSAVSECSGGNNGVSRNDSSSGATGYDSDIHDSKSSLSMLPSFSSMDSGIQSQVILKTPYGTMRRDETLGFYGLVPEHQQLRRCHTLERDILSRPRLHTIEERRRYTLEKDYVDKHIQRRHTFRGSSMPTSLANSRSGSAASSPIPPEFLAYQNHDFIPISVAEATSISARGSPMLNQDNLLPFPTVSSKPGSPNPRPRSESMGNTDLEQMRPRCYSFHMNSEGRASRFPMQGDNQLMDSNMYMSPEMRRGSVGASYGLHHRKKSLLVDRHPRYLSRLSEGMKRVDKPTKPSEASTSLPSNEHLSPLSIHVPKLAEQLSWKLDKSLLDNPIKYEDQEQDDNAMDVESPMEMDSIKEVNKESSKSSDCGQVESVFHKKFDKMRKHTPVPSDSSSRKSSFESQGNLVISEDDPERSMMDIPNQDLAKLQISDDIRESSAKPMKKSAIDSHPQLLAQLNTPSRNSFQPGFLKLPLKMSSSPSSSTQTPVMLNVPKFSGRPSASTVAKELPTLASHLNSAPVAPVYPAQMELSNGKIKEQAHSVTMSHLKEKLGRTNESAKNLSSRSPEAMNTLNKQQTEESQFSSSPEGFTSSNHEKMMNIHGMGTGMEGQERMFSSNLQKMGMHSAFLGNSPNYMPMFMMPGYNQHLAGMQQLAQIYAAKSNEEQMKRKEMTLPNSSGPHRVVDMDINVNQHLEQSVKKEIG